MAANYPLGIPPKEDLQSRLLRLAGVPQKYWISADEFNHVCQVVQGLLDNPGSGGTGGSATIYDTFVYKGSLNSQSDLNNITVVDNYELYQNNSGTNYYFLLVKDGAPLSSLTNRRIHIHQANESFDFPFEIQINNVNFKAYIVVFDNSQSFIENISYVFNQWVHAVEFSPSGSTGNSVQQPYDDVNALLADRGNQQQNNLYYVRDTSDDNRTDGGLTQYSLITLSNPAVITDYQVELTNLIPAPEENLNYYFKALYQGQTTINNLNNQNISVDYEVQFVSSINAYVLKVRNTRRENFDYSKFIYLEQNIRFEVNTRVTPANSNFTYWILNFTPNPLFNGGEELTFDVYFATTGGGSGGSGLTPQQAQDLADNTSARHNHSNLATLEKFGEDAQGKPTYNGNAVDTTIAQRDVYDGLDSTNNTVSLSANQGKVLNDRITGLTETTVFVTVTSNLNTSSVPLGKRVVIANGSSNVTVTVDHTHSDNTYEKTGTGTVTFLTSNGQTINARLNQTELVNVFDVAYLGQTALNTHKLDINRPTQ